ncbi:MAG TPA: CBS domain-containing protein [Pyrinomonadaceae bacterium]|jgi:CBS domain-containing protein
MSRNRYDRDDDGGYYGGGGRGGRGGGWGSGVDRTGADRSQYDRADYSRGREYGYDDAYGARDRARSGRDYESGNYGNYGRAGYGERDDDRDYGRRSGGYRDERYDRDDDRGDDRSFFEDARDYVRGRSASRGRRASRSRVRCRDIMTRDVTVATRDSTLEEVARMMKDEDTGIIPVVDYNDAPTTATSETGDEAPRNAARPSSSNGRLVGLITDRDIVIRAVAEGKDTRTTRAEEVMTADVHSAKPNDRVIDAIRKMGDKQVRRIPVVGENGNLRGIISMADIALETEEDEELADALEEISSGASFWNKIFG